ncbi:PaaI family thioesterase [Hyphomonas sp. FCG-A18]|uniref:PaaI family thioesterase n=1 Tax=Hyphomonas sp. FCG-A18 TaxID=3080019 RepID=UPI002B2BA45F|nr:PaaI family thioesterase [Hyphomonas sp. FCG-A18]
MRESDLPDHLRVPDGFVLSSSRGRFTNHNGPVYMTSAKGDLRSGMFVLDRHCNGMGFLHGGMASAFADRSLAVAVWNATQKMSVTLKLTMHFYETVRLHDWLEAHPVVLSAENGIVQVSADLLIDGGKLAARADATFRSLRRTAK